MHSEGEKPHMRMLGLILAAAFAGTTAFAMNLAAPVSPIQPPVTGTTSTVNYYRPACHQYRTVTMETAANGELTQTIHHPGYCIDKNGVVSPEIQHRYYRVTRNGVVEPTNNNDCQDGSCQLPGRGNQTNQ